MDGNLGHGSGEPDPGARQSSVPDHGTNEAPDSLSDSRTEADPAARFASLREPAVLVALIGAVAVVLAAIIGGVATYVVQRGGDKPPTLSDPVNAVSPTAGSSSLSTAPGGPPSSKPVTGRWLVEDGALSVLAGYEPGIFPFAGSTFLMPADGIAPSSWPNQLGDPEGYARTHGGFPAGVAAVQLVIRAKADKPVIITSIVPQVVERLLTPDAGYAVKVHYGCGGIPVRAVLGDFDSDPVKISYDTGEGKKLADRMALNVTPADPQVVVVNGMAQKESVAWNVLIRYDSPAGPGELLVDENSKPFVTSDVKEGTPVWDYQDFSGLTTAPDGQPYGYC